MSDLPRVLVVAHEPFGAATSSSFTLSSLFRGWPRERLAQVYSAPAAPDFDVCSRYWQIRASGLRQAGAEARPQPGVRRAVPVRPGGGARFMGLKRALAFLLDLQPPQTESPAFRDWLSEFNPDVVYSWLGSNRQMALVRHICAGRRIPAVPHFMDDWLTSTLSHPLLGPLQALTFRRSLNRLLPYCHGGLGISAAMAEEYAVRLRLPMSYAANGVEDDLLESLRAGSGAREAEDGEFRFSVIGRLEYGRTDILMDFVNGLAQQVVQGGRKAVLAVYSDSALPGSLLQNGRVKVEHHPGPRDPDLAGVQARTDCLLYVDHFGEFTRRYFRLSFSGKIPICLALGRPIITIGPADLNSVRLLRDCRVGPVVTTRDPQALGEAACAVMAWEPGTRREAGLQAWRSAQQDYRAGQQRARLHASLQAAVTGPVLPSA